MNTVTLQAEVRETRGKGPARRLRSQGKLPAVFYGPGVEPTPLTLSPKEVETALRSPHGRNMVFALNVHGTTELAMVRDLEKDPVHRGLVHVDLYRVFEDSEVEVTVVFRVTGRAVGAVKGGDVIVARRDVPVRSKPTEIPEEIVVDVTNLDIGESITAGDLSLPAGIEVALRPNVTLVSVVEHRRALDETVAAGATPAAGAAG